MVPIEVTRSLWEIEYRRDVAMDGWPTPWLPEFAPNNVSVKPRTQEPESDQTRCVREERIIIIKFNPF